ncbi:MAG TPA: TetR/AcrR family transcriptional regulator [Rhizomicrobium sp.]
MPKSELKLDRRKERTQRALMRAFVELVLTKGYANVSVEEIAARADVGRSTFYMHYSGREALLKHSLSHPCEGLVALVGREASTEALLPRLAHFHSQRTVNRVFFVDPIRRIWMKRLAEMIEPRLATIAKQTRAQPLLPLPLAAEAIAEAQIGLVANWLAQRGATKPQAVAEALIAATQALIAALLQPAESQPRRERN